MQAWKMLKSCVMHFLQSVLLEMSEKKVVYIVFKTTDFWRALSKAILFTDVFLASFLLPIQYVQEVFPQVYSQHRKRP